MPTVDQIQDKNGNNFDIEDSAARAAIQDIDALFTPTNWIEIPSEATLTSNWNGAVHYKRLLKNLVFFRAIGGFTTSGGLSDRVNTIDICSLTLPFQIIEGYMPMPGYIEGTSGIINPLLHQSYLRLKIYYDDPTTSPQSLRVRVYGLIPVQFSD